jgi:acetoacetate decarboxylase
MTRYSAAPDDPPRQDGPDGPKMWSRNLVVVYETEPGLTASVLPRPLEPTDPHVRLNFVQVELPSGQPMSAGTVSVLCRHGEVLGSYDLLMIMSLEGAVLGGRDTFGEPKKLGSAAVEHDGDAISARMTRNGIDLAEVRGRVAEQLDPGGVEERFAFYFKFLLDPEGGRFDGDPSLVHVRRTQEDRLRLRVEGELTLRDSQLDPIADLPVRRVVSMTYSENRQTQTGRIVQTVPGEWVWPFRHQRYDDHPTDRAAALDATA